MSPDGKWIWDGAQWRPIAVHEAAFPNWKSVGNGFVPGADIAAPAFASPPTMQRQASPAASYRMAGPAPGLAAPNWGQGAGAVRRGIQKYAPMAIGAAGLVVVIVIVSVVATLVLSNRSTATPSVATVSTGTGPASRSESAQAAFVIKSLQAGMADLHDNVTYMGATCRAGMTSACEDSAISVANTIEPMLPILDSATIPACIATTEGVLRTNLGNASDTQKLMVKAFSQNKQADFTAGYKGVIYYGVNSLSGYVLVQRASVNCDSTVTGP